MNLFVWGVMLLCVENMGVSSFFGSWCAGGHKVIMGNREKSHDFVVSILLRRRCVDSHGLSGFFYWF